MAGRNCNLSAVDLAKKLKLPYVPKPSQVLVPAVQALGYLQLFRYAPPAALNAVASAVPQRLEYEVAVPPVKDSSGRTYPERHVSGSVRYIHIKPVASVDVRRGELRVEFVIEDGSAAGRPIDPYQDDTVQRVVVLAAAFADPPGSTLIGYGGIELPSGPFHKISIPDLVGVPWTAVQAVDVAVIIVRKFAEDAAGELTADNLAPAWALWRWLERNASEVRATASALLSCCAGGESAEKSVLDGLAKLEDYRTALTALFSLLSASAVGKGLYRYLGIARAVEVDGGLGGREATVNAGSGVPAVSPITLMKAWGSPLDSIMQAAGVPAPKTEDVVSALEGAELPYYGSLASLVEHVVPGAADTITAAMELSASGTLKDAADEILSHLANIKKTSGAPVLVSLTLEDGTKLTYLTYFTGKTQLSSLAAQIYARLVQDWGEAAQAVKRVEAVLIQPAIPRDAAVPVPPQKVRSMSADEASELLRKKLGGELDKVVRALRGEYWVPVTAVPDAGPMAYFYLPIGAPEWVWIPSAVLAPAVFMLRSEYEASDPKVRLVRVEDEVRVRADKRIYPLIGKIGVQGVVVSVDKDGKSVSYWPVYAEDIARAGSGAPKPKAWIGGKEADIATAGGLSLGKLGAEVDGTPLYAMLMTKPEFEISSADPIDFKVLKLGNLPEIVMVNKLTDSEVFPIMLTVSTGSFSRVDLGVVLVGSDGAVLGAGSAEVDLSPKAGQGEVTIKLSYKQDKSSKRVEVRASGPDVEVVGPYAPEDIAEIKVVLFSRALNIIIPNPISNYYALDAVARIVNCAVHGFCRGVKAYRAKLGDVLGWLSEASSDREVRILECCGVRLPEFAALAVASLYCFLRTGRLECLGLVEEWDDKEGLVLRFSAGALEDAVKGIWVYPDSALEAVVRLGHIIWPAFREVLEQAGAGAVLPLELVGQAFQAADADLEAVVVRRRPVTVRIEGFDGRTLTVSKDEGRAVLHIRAHLPPQLYKVSEVGAVYELPEEGGKHAVPVADLAFSQLVQALTPADPDAVARALKKLEEAWKDGKPCLADPKCAAEVASTLATESVVSALRSDPANLLAFASPGLLKAVRVEVSVTGANELLVLPDGAKKEGGALVYGSVRYVAEDGDELELKDPEEAFGVDSVEEALKDYMSGKSEEPPENWVLTALFAKRTVKYTGAGGSAKQISGWRQADVTRLYANAPQLRPDADDISSLFGAAEPDAFLARASYLAPTGSLTAPASLTEVSYPASTSYLPLPLTYAIASLRLEGAGWRAEAEMEHSNYALRAEADLFFPGGAVKTVKVEGLSSSSAVREPVWASVRVSTTAPGSATVAATVLDLPKWVSEAVLSGALLPALAFYDPTGTSVVEVVNASKDPATGRFTATAGAGLGKSYRPIFAPVIASAEEGGRLGATKVELFGGKLELYLDAGMLPCLIKEVYVGASPSEAVRVEAGWSSGGWRSSGLDMQTKVVEKTALVRTGGGYVPVPLSLTLYKAYGFPFYSALIVDWLKGLLVEAGASLLPYSRSSPNKMSLSINASLKTAAGYVVLPKSGDSTKLALALEAEKTYVLGGGSAVVLEGELTSPTFTASWTESGGDPRTGSLKLLGIKAEVNKLKEALSQDDGIPDRWTIRLVARWTRGEMEVVEQISASTASVHPPSVALTRDEKGGSFKISVNDWGFARQIIVGAVGGFDPQAGQPYVALRCLRVGSRPWEVEVVPPKIGALVGAFAGVRPVALSYVQPGGGIGSAKAFKVLLSSGSAVYLSNCGAPLLAAPDGETLDALIKLLSTQTPVTEWPEKRPEVAGNPLEVWRDVKVDVPSSLKEALGEGAAKLLLVLAAWADGAAGTSVWGSAVQPAAVAGFVLDTVMPAVLGLRPRGFVAEVPASWEALACGRSRLGASDVLELAQTECGEPVVKGGVDCVPVKQAAGYGGPGATRVEQPEVVVRAVLLAQTIAKLTRNDPKMNLAAVLAPLLAGALISQLA